MSNANRELEQDGLEFLQCYNCIHKNKPEPSPCNSCEQSNPTNYEEG